tara:strand:+ start:10044 stop:11060 length:1017 start_codon:yes stop_codon:yes gene_type:complete
MAKISIVGTGLIGTSLALALKEANINNLEIVGTDYSRDSRIGAQKSGGFDKIENRLLNAIKDSDIVVLAVPVMAMEETMGYIADDLKEGCIVTDVGSTKRSIAEWAKQILPDHVDYVGGHPMAGKETHGPEHADATLFTDKVYCVIPSPTASKESVEQISKLAVAVKAEPYYISLDEHDSYVAAVSHLPFVMSTALMQCTSASENWDDISHLAASGFRDITRLASGDPIMHKDISVSNSEHITHWINMLINNLESFKELLNQDDNEKAEDAVLSYFADALGSRETWLNSSPSLSAKRYDYNKEVPSFSDGIGEMFFGKRLMDAQKRLMGDWGTNKKKK